MSLLLAIQGGISGDTTGTLSTTLGGIVFAGAGSESISGAQSVTLGGLAFAGLGTETITGSLSTNLGGITFAGLGTSAGASASGVMAITLGSIIVSASGSTIFPQNAVIGGGIDHQRKRKASTVSDRPNEQLDSIIAKAFKTVFGELTDKKVPKEVQKKANKIVSAYSTEYRPTFNQVDWFALNQNLEAVQQLFNLYQREIAQERQKAEAIRVFNLIENDNLEFLLMH